MKTFKGKARGWFYVDGFCGDMEKENLVSEGVGGAGGLQSSGLTDLVGETEREQPGAEEKGCVGSVCWAQG